MRKTIKVIDLLNKIANREQPREIEFDTEIYVWNDAVNSYTRLFNCDAKFYKKIEDDYDLINCLNDEVEIIEEDKEIEEAKIKTFEDTGEAVTILRVHEYNDLNFKELKRVTDELVKAVNELKKGK